MYLSAESIKINDKVNLITKAYSFEDIKFLSKNCLTKYDEYINYVNRFQIDIFHFKIDKEKSNLVSNIKLSKGTFISIIVGLYCFRKTKEYENENNKGFKELFLFKCHEKNYDRLLKSIKYVNIGSIIAETKNNHNGNYHVNTNLEVKLGIITSKDIKIYNTKLIIIIVLF